MVGYYAPCPEFDACIRLIQEYFQTGQYAQCFQGHLALAERGYPLAECQVGYFYYEGLGVERDRLGDILVSPHSADIAAAPSLRDFFLREWTQAGRVRLTVSEIGREELLLPQIQVKTIRDTVATLRLDAVTACGFSLSRSKAAALIASGKVALNHRECLKADRPVAEGDVLTCRGLGKCVVKEVPGQSKKGRTMLVLERYV